MAERVHLAEGLQKSHLRLVTGLDNEVTVPGLSPPLDPHWPRKTGAADAVKL
jgi:hypothetical protein